MERVSKRRLPNLALGSRTEAPIRHRFELTGPSPSTIDYLVEEGKARVEPAGENQPTETYRCSTDTFVLMMYGRVGTDEAMGEGKLRRVRTEQLEVGDG